MRTLIVALLIASMFYLSYGTRDFMSATKHLHAQQIETALRQ